MTGNFILYQIPFSYYETKGTLKVRVRAEGFDSEYIDFSIPNDISSTDNIMVKIENDKYVVKILTPNKYYDLPIASQTQYGVVKVGDNLKIENGVLSATSTGGSGGGSSVILKRW